MDYKDTKTIIQLLEDILSQLKNVDSSVGSLCSKTDDVWIKLD